MVESVLLIVSAITAIAAGGGIVGVALLIAGIVFLLFSAYAYIHSIMLMCAYMEGDEEAGKELVKDMWINIGVTIGTFALRTIAKPIISKVLKNKLVREFGQEFVDKLLKNTDDITTAGRAIKKLRKLNVGDDVICELGERFGQKGYDWLLNKQNLKLSDDIIKKLMKTDNFMSYSDDLLRAIQKSNGYADDIIRQVEKYGDDVADAIAKYGDDAADVINQYGDDAVDSLKEGKTPDEIREIYKNTDETISEADRIKIDNWEYRPSDELYLKYKDVFDNPKYYDQETGEIHWPVNDGFKEGSKKDAILKGGTIFKRYGSNSGEFLGNATDSFESRALAPHSDGAEVHYYQLIENYEMTTGIAAPWFGSKGGAEQFVKYKLDGSKYTIKELEDAGILEDITDLVEKGEIQID